MEHKSLPPSPPASTSTKSSPELTSPGSPPASDLTPPKSPPRPFHNNTSSPPNIGSSPLPPLPAEVFQLIIDHVPAPQRARLRRVCKSWQNFLDAEPSFWSYLRAYPHAYNPELFDRWTNLASVNRRGKPGGGVESLEILHLARVDQRTGRTFDWIDEAGLKSNMAHLLKAMEQACVPITPSLVRDGRPDGVPDGPSTLRHMFACSQPNSVNAAWFLHVLAENCRRPLFNRLRLLRVYANIPDLVLDRSFLSMWPLLQQLSVEGTSGAEALHRITGGKWLWQPPQQRGDGPRNLCSHLPNLQRIDWRRLNIGCHLHIPVIDNLVSLSLTTVEWEGRSFFRLLRYARHTLVTLELDDVSLLEAPGDEWNDWVMNVNIRDPEMVDDEPPAQQEVAEPDSELPSAPAPIILHALRVLVVKGEATPPFWTSLEWVDQMDEEMPYPTPQLVMPVLERFVLDEAITEQESIPDEIDAPLPALGRNAPNVTYFELVNSSATDRAVFQCFAAMNASIRTLVFANSDITDSLLMSLVQITPRISYLDTRGCQFISIQSVARLVQLLREAGNPPMTHVFVDHPTTHSTTDDWRAHWWLDWVGLLGRDEHDPAGDGPRNSTLRRQWKIQGKTSHEAIIRRQWEVEVEKEREAAARIAAIQLANGLGGSGYPGGSSGSSSGSSSVMGSRLPSQLSMATLLPADVARQSGPGWPAIYLRGQQQGHPGFPNFSLAPSVVPTRLPARPDPPPKAASTPTSPAATRRDAEQAPASVATDNIDVTE